jgi:hypothetical protein
VGQSLASFRRRKQQPAPATGDELPVGVGEAGRRSNTIVFELAALAVADLVERSEHILTEAGGFFENGADKVARYVLERGQLAYGGHSGDFFKDEAHVGERR